MTSHRKSDTTDSLELLLDTICNVFGGIIFIAILVALLTMFQTSTYRSGHAPVIQTADTVGDEWGLRAEIDEYEQGFLELKRTQDMIGPERVRAEARLAKSLSEAQTKAQRKRDKLRQWIRQYKLLDNRIEVIDRKWKSEKDKVDRLLAMQRTSRDVNTVDARLPLERKTHKRQLTLIMKSGKAHWVRNPWRGHELDQALIKNNAVIEEYTKFGFRATPRPGAGIAIDRNLDRNSEFKLIMNATKPERDFFEFYVSKDSVQSFRHFKRAILQRGYDYNVHTIDSVDGTVMFKSVESLYAQ